MAILTHSLIEVCVLDSTSSVEALILSCLIDGCAVPPSPSILQVCWPCQFLPGQNQSRIMHYVIRLSFISHLTICVNVRCFSNDMNFFKLVSREVLHSFFHMQLAENSNILLAGYTKRRLIPFPSFIPTLASLLF